MLEECQTKWDFEQCIVYRDKIYELQKAVFLTTTCPLCGTLTYYTHHTRITRSHFRMCSQRNHPTAHKWTLHAHTPHSNATLLIMDLFVSCVVGLDEAQCTESAIVSIVHMLMLCLSNMRPTGHTVASTMTHALHRGQARSRSQYFQQPQLWHLHLHQQLHQQPQLLHQLKEAEAAAEAGRTRSRANSENGSCSTSLYAVLYILCARTYVYLYIFSPCL